MAAMKSFLAAFNRRDLTAIMEYFADDCVLYLTRDSSPRDACFEGKAEIRKGLATRCAGLPDVHYADDSHWVLRQPDHHASLAP